MFTPKDPKSKTKLIQLVLPADHALVVGDDVALCCGRRLLAGQSVVYRRFLAQEAYAYRWLVFHRRCLFSALLDMPLDQDEQAFEELRASIVAAGDVFATEEG